MAIKPGWKEGTRVIFEGKGDRLPGRPPQDVVFVIKQVPHPRFTRQGDDLVTEASAPCSALSPNMPAAVRCRRSQASVQSACGSWHCNRWQRTSTLQDLKN